jgi:hypothetical protein
MKDDKKKHLQTRNVLGKIPFYQNQTKSISSKDKPKDTTQKSGTATTELVNLK